MLQRHYPVPVVVLRKIYKIPRYSCNLLLIRRKTLTSEEEFEFWEETEVRYDSEIHVCACLSKMKRKVRSNTLSKNLQLACVIIRHSTCILK